MLGRYVAAQHKEGTHLKLEEEELEGDVCQMYWEVHVSNCIVLTEWLLLASCMKSVKKNYGGYLVKMVLHIYLKQLFEICNVGTTVIGN